MRTDIVQDYTRVIEVDHGAGKREVGRQKMEGGLGLTARGRAGHVTTQV
jgi:hypothetical protein